MILFVLGLWLGRVFGWVGLDGYLLVGCLVVFFIGVLDGLFVVEGCLLIGWFWLVGCGSLIGFVTCVICMFTVGLV